MNKSDDEIRNILHEKQEAIIKLESVIDDLHKRIAEINEKLKESESLKSHFISNITNEIVNPFTSILGLSKSIISLGDDEIDKARSKAELIHMEAFQLDFDLKNIFMAARIEAGEIEQDISRSDINKLINSSIEQFRIEIDKKKIHIDKELFQDEEKLYFKTDPEKFKLIIGNIISNAVKFSDEESKIFIESSLEDHSLIIKVKDLGKGIEPEKLKEIFDRFKQLDSTIHSLNRGYGLGLSVAGALIEILNGEIDIVSDPGVETIFIVSIPESTEEADDVSTDDNEIFFNEDEIL